MFYCLMLFTKHIEKHMKNSTKMITSYSLSWPWAPRYRSREGAGGVSTWTASRRNPSAIRRDIIVSSVLKEILSPAKRLLMLFAAAVASRVGTLMLRWGPVRTKFLSIFWNKSKKKKQTFKFYVVIYINSIIHILYFL